MWINLTESDVQEKMVGSELDACREMALAEGQADPLDGVINEVVQEVRGYVGSKFPLSSGNTIPQKLRGAALVLIRDRLLTRFPVIISSNDDRTQQVKDALQLLRDVAAGKFLVDTPDDAVTGEVASTTAVKIISSTRQKFTRDSLNGL